MIINSHDTVDFIAIWQEGMRDWKGHLPERMSNDALEENFWKQLIDKKPLHTFEDPYVKQIQAHLAPMLAKEDEVLEIGPGWGNYTFFLSNHVKRVTGVDSSQHVLDFLKEVQVEKEIHNLDLVHQKWEEYEVTHKYDVVFGINCFYRMFDIKGALLNIHHSAKRLAIVGMTSGPIQPHYVDLHQKYGYQIKWPRRDYIHLQNILYDLGIYAECKIIKLERTYRFHTFDELIQKNKQKILDLSIQDQHIEQALQPYIKFENGAYTYKHDFHAALLYWTPNV
ncbi:class I SAM-dependent methyltransferase [Peribacillus asahii]|uniref:class I SAM-dependent methyltransferase n=1 Tax=Peribacillus asahii TaxID=228899 RepID=UPI002079593F|nr:class I SAM-dependent methyltransferase [Peribacillus asahii]USK71947.1 class I SAM-dependent methyltransferase [Peribacillus asahii]